MSKTIDLPFTPEDMAAGRVADPADILVRLRSFNSVTMEDAAKEIERLRSALRPFANYADPRCVVPDDMVITNGSGFTKRQLTMVDCRRAAATLKS